MSPDILLKLFYISIISISLAYVVFARYDNEIGSEKEDARQRYLPYIPGSLLPLCMLTIIVLCFYVYGLQMTIEMTLSMYFTIFVHISIFYAILLMCLPLLRKFIHARAIAMLWMIPNYLYIVEAYNTDNPLFIVKVPEQLVWTLFGLAVSGFVAVMMWHFISHFIFRTKVLKDSKPITDPRILEIWNKEIEKANIKKPKFKLVCSPNIQTPLSIGLFKRTTKVVLPEKHYNQDELSLIFRHEIVHIGREDVWSKFFLVFCTALCWYNPLLWIAKKKCSDDLELSCDETVLLDSDEETRRKYGNLLLNTALEEKGFTTCLSATRSTTHYRIQNILKPKKLHTGAIIIGLTFFILCSTCGFFALAYGDATGKEILYKNQNVEEYKLRNTTLEDDEFNTVYKCINEKEFHEYLSSLTFSKMTGNFSFKDNDKRYTYIFETPEGTLGVVLSEEVIKLVKLYEDDSVNYYYLPDRVDWDYLESIVIPCPALDLHLMDDRNTYGKNTSTKLVQYDRIINNTTNTIYKFEEPTDDVSGVFGHDYRPYEAQLTFSYDNVIEYSVTIETWDRKSSYTIHSNELENKFTISLPNYPAHYTFNVTFQENGYTSNAVFAFNIGEIE